MPRTGQYVLSVLCVLSVLSVLFLSACLPAAQTAQAGRTPDQAAAQRAEAAQRQRAAAGRDSRQESVSTTDQRQQQTSEAAPVAPAARDVGAMTVTARADFHDYGKRQLVLEQQRERQRMRYAVAIGMSVVGLLLTFAADNLMRDHTHYRMIIVLVGVCVCVAPWVPLLFS